MAVSPCPGATLPLAEPGLPTSPSSPTSGADDPTLAESFRSPIERQNLEDMAICLAAAVTGVVRDKYSREKELWKVFREARQGLHSAGNLAPCFQRLLALAHSVDGAEFDPLLPFLQSCDELWPYSEMVGPHEPLNPAAVESMRELLLLEVAQGSMHEFFRPHGDVENWIGTMAGRVRAILCEFEGLRGDASRFITPLLMGMAVTLHDLLGGLTPYFQRVRDRSRKEYSFVAHVIGEIRRALLWTIVRDFRTDVRALTGKDAVGEAVERFSKPRLKLYALPSRVEFQNVRFYLERLLTDLDDLHEVFGDLDSVHALRPLAATLLESPYFHTGEGVSAGKEKVLPFGQVGLIHVYGKRNEHTLYYTADGVAHECILAHSHVGSDAGADAEIGPILQPNASFTLRNVLSCCLDDCGKAYFGAIDRLAPTGHCPAYAEAERSVARVDVALNRAMLEEWEAYPDLFARLDTLGPLLIVHLPAAKYLLCRAEAWSEVHALRSWKACADVETVSLLERIGLNVKDDWVSVLLEDHRSEQDDLLAGDPRRKWRSLIRKRMERNRIPDFRRLVEKLAEFGVRETSHGKGSHGTLQTPGRDGRKQTTWYALRHKANPLPITFVWECLERLGIGYQDFYRSLGQD